MKIQLEFEDDENVMLDIRESLFVTLLKAELADSERNFERFTHKDDRAVYKANIKACKVLLSYYTVQEQPEWKS
jgi:hypothetical protein